MPVRGPPETPRAGARAPALTCLFVGGVFGKVEAPGRGLELGLAGRASHIFGAPFHTFGWFITPGQGPDDRLRLRQDELFEYGNDLCSCGHHGDLVPDCERFATAGHVLEQTAAVLTDRSRT